MKIDRASHLPAANARTSTLAHPAQSFAAHLQHDPSALLEASRHRALGFGEAGLFGPGHPTPSSIAQRSERLADVAPAGSNEEQHAAGAVQATKPSLGGPVICPVAPPGRATPEAAAPQSSAQSPARLPVATQAGARISQQMDWPVLAKTPPVPGTPAGFADLRSRPSTRKGLSLIIAEEPDGLIQVAARSAPLSSDEIQELRKRAGDLAVEIGLPLSGFLVNGADISSNRKA